MKGRDMAIKGEFIGAHSRPDEEDESVGAGEIYFDDEHRFITLSGAISWRMADIFFNTLTAFENKSPQKPVTLFLNSEGGDVYSTWKIFDHMRNSSCQIITVVAGIVFSGGLMLFLAGDKRLVFPHATLGFHKPYKSSNGKEDPDESAASAAHHQEMWQQILEMFEGNTQLTRDQLAEYFRGSKKVDAETAVRIGLAEKIIRPQPKIFLPNHFTEHQLHLLANTMP